MSPAKARAKALVGLLDLYPDYAITGQNCSENNLRLGLPTIR